MNHLKCSGTKNKLWRNEFVVFSNISDSTGTLRCHVIHLESSYQNLAIHFSSDNLWLFFSSDSSIVIKLRMCKQTIHMNISWQEILHFIPTHFQSICFLHYKGCQWPIMPQIPTRLKLHIAIGSNLKTNNKPISHLKCLFRHLLWHAMGAPMVPQVPGVKLLCNLPLSTYLILCHCTDENLTSKYSFYHTGTTCINQSEHEKLIKTYRICSSSTSPGACSK